MKHSVIHVYTDGGARGNPGPSAIGVVLCDAKDTILLEHREYLGETTNNVAEYTALIRALEIAKDFTTGEVVCTSDSELLVKQLHGEYAVKAEHLRPLFNQIQELKRPFKTVRVLHTRRDHRMIKHADSIVNEVLDAVARRETR